MAKLVFEMWVEVTPKVEVIIPDNVSENDDQVDEAVIAFLRDKYGAERVDVIDCHINPPNEKFIDHHLTYEPKTHEVSDD